MKSSVQFEIIKDSLLQQQYAIQALREWNMEKQHSFHISTYGCQMNEHDSEKIAGILLQMGFVETHTQSQADVILFNTCAIRENAEMRVYGNVGHVKHYKEKNKDVIIGICGCMMQQPHVIETLKKSYPYVELIFGTHNFHQLPGYLYDIIFKNKKVIEVLKDSDYIIEDLPVSRREKIKSYINIMEGCNNYCTYCIVPFTRGRERSRAYTDIVEEVKKLVEDGVMEITLLGQNVNSYHGGCSFAELLTKLNDIENLHRIRFMTSHPKDLNDDVIDAMANLDKVCESLHLPVHSGSNRVLKKMNRSYTREKYLDTVEKIKKKIPNIALTTDIIIGFPGETMQDVEDTVDLIKKVDYDSAFTFIYSARQGTPAAKFEDDATEEEKHRRFEYMLEELNKGVILKNKQRLGNIYEVLVETYDEDTGICEGKSREFFRIKFKGNMDLVGKLVNVKITNPKYFSLEGEII